MAIKRIVWLLVITLLAAAAFPALAQGGDNTAEHPFLQMLALAPVSAALPSEDSTIYVSYADYRALERARAGVPSPQTLADFQVLWDAGAPEAQLWIQNNMRLNAGWPDYNEYMRTGAALMPEAVGFDFFDIDRALVFLHAPRTGVLFGGEFDAETINAAYAAQEYTPNDINGVALWCGPVGCADGLKLNLAERYSGRVFGDAFGQQWPVFVSPEYLFSAAEPATVERWAAAYVGQADSLLDVPEFRAIGEAITAGEGSLVQAEFFLPSSVAYGEVFVLSVFSQEVADAIRGVVAGYGPLPLYNLFAFADRQEGDHQVTVLALAYVDEASAQQAAEELATRMRTFPHIEGGASDQPAIADEALGAVMVGSDVYYSEAAERYVTLVTLAYSMPDNTLYDLDGEPAVEGDGGQARPSGLLHRLLFRRIVERMLTPLWVELPE